MWAITPLAHPLEAQEESGEILVLGMSSMTAETEQMAEPALGVAAVVQAAPPRTETPAQARLVPLPLLAAVPVEMAELMAKPLRRDLEEVRVVDMPMALPPPVGPVNVRSLTTRT